MRLSDLSFVDLGDGFEDTGKILTLRARNLSE